MLENIVKDDYLWWYIVIAISFIWCQIFDANGKDDHLILLSIQTHYYNPHHVIEIYSGKGPRAYTVHV